jgi:hypothetical protein
MNVLTANTLKDYLQVCIRICNNIKKKKIVTQSRTGLQIYEGHDDQLNRQGPMA